MKKKTRRKIRTALRYTGFTLVTLMLIGMTTAAICGIAFAVYINRYVSPEVDVDLDSVRLNLTSFVYYVDPATGEEKELETLFGDENRVWADIDEIPDMMQKAFVAIEDARFYTHNGVDWKRTIGAALNYVVRFRDNFGGGSTITQQLIKNITGDDETSVKRKIQEVMRALELEKKYEKDDILELYLNTIYFGQRAYGVQSAAQTYFGKDVSQLSLAECAAIAGITKNPYKYDMIRFPENNKERQELVLQQMLEYGIITQAEHDAAVAEELQIVRDDGSGAEDQYQSYFVDAVISQVLKDLQEQKGYSESMAKTLLYTGGLRVVTTIDVDIQAKMDAVFQDVENFPGGLGKDGTMPQAAMVIMDPYTGKVLAMYGGRGEKTGNRVFNRATQAHRSPGSSIKPLSVYAPGIEYGVITPFTVLDDAPKDFQQRAGGWPKNENGSYGGRTTVMKAVERSLNTIAVEVLQEVGVERAFRFTHTNLGLSSLVESRVDTNKKGEQIMKTDVALSPLALGGVTDGVTVLEMTAAYSAFTNNGTYTRPILYTRVYDSSGNIVLEQEPEQTVSMSAKTATYMVEILKNVVTGSQGTGRRAALGNGIEVGGKTGTTDDSFDRWFAGITPYYTGVVWFGYDKPQDVGRFDTNPALYLWKQVMSAVHENLEPRSFNLSTELKSVSICADSGMLASEWCSQDVRGSRVMTARLAAEDVPKARCTMHVPVEIDSVTGGIANEWCPLDDIKQVAMLSLQREYPASSVRVADQKYVVPYTPAAGTYAPTSDGMSSAAVCTVHSEQNNGNPPEEPPEDIPPEDPNDPNNPNNPDDPNTSNDPEYPPPIIQPPGEEEQPGGEEGDPPQPDPSTEGDPPSGGTEE